MAESFSGVLHEKELPREVSITQIQVGRFEPSRRPGRADCSRLDAFAGMILQLLRISSLVSLKESMNTSQFHSRKVYHQGHQVCLCTGSQRPSFSPSFPFARFPRPISSPAGLIYGTTQCDCIASSIVIYVTNSAAIRSHKGLAW
jgi:hypothetical protein